MATRSTPGLFGGIVHYDDQGNEVGRSWEGPFRGSYNHYNQNGEFVGYSDPGFFSDYVHSDATGHRLGATYRVAPGYYTTFDEEGYTGTTIGTSYGADSDFDFDF